jgi:hypothetical protein
MLFNNMGWRKEYDGVAALNQLEMPENNEATAFCGRHISHLIILLRLRGLGLDAF